MSEGRREGAAAPVDNRKKFIRRVFATSTYLQELCEEGECGDTRAIRSLKPAHLERTANSIVREHMRQMFEDRHLSLTEAAWELSAWNPNHSEKQLPPAEIAGDLADMCRVHERERESGLPHDKADDPMWRSFIRAARYIRLMQEEGATPNSRLEFFVPNKEKILTKGVGKNGAGHQEHVVPCVFLCREACSRFAAGQSIEDVAALLHRHLAIVEIAKAESSSLDRGKASDSMGLKESMPIGWGWTAGCIYQRLHDAGIEFTLISARLLEDRHHCRCTSFNQGGAEIGRLCVSISEQGEYR